MSRGGSGIDSSVIQMRALMENVQNSSRHVKLMSRQTELSSPIHIIDVNVCPKLSHNNSAAHYILLRPRCN
jgi:hypothetical protein